VSTLTVIKPGMLTTIQDLGRRGYQNSGVPVAGPMDGYSHRLANRLAGNADTAAALEVTMIGPELRAEGDVHCAVAGAWFDLTVGDQPVDVRRPFTVASGQALRFGERRQGARATLAVRGGIDVAPIFDSRATSVVSRMGPLGGRPLAAGDCLPIAPGSGAGPALPAGRRLAMPKQGARVRIIVGPHAHMFTTVALELLLSCRYVVSPQSNRMGYRLEGRPLEHVAAAEILSDATPVGSLQVPASGQPILLMADRQTTGGYPKIGTVISADLPVAGQLAPGDWIEFAACTRAEAVDALRTMHARLAGREA
jgi:antagonist of KipI